MEEMIPYSQSIYRELDFLAALEYRFDQGKIEGLAEGRAEGKEEALQMTARKLLNAGMDIDFIHQITGLPLSEIKRLKND